LVHFSHLFWNHKLNLSIRTAIVSHPVVCGIFGKPNKFCDIVQWGSDYAILEMYKKAFDRGFFQNIYCSLPFDISIIDMLLEILKPAYLMNINFQSKRAYIANFILVRNLLNFELLKNCSRRSAIKLQLEKSKYLHVLGQQFCNLLVQQLEIRFSYGMNSQIIQVHALSLTYFLIFFNRIFNFERSQR
jgi:hypothetical protein